MYIKSTPPRIVIATGIYPPEVGGPAFYAKNLKTSLSKGGHVVDVVTYGSLKKFPTGIRHIAYALRLFMHVRRSDTVIVLDTFSVGLPAAIVNFFVRVPMIIRLGGDFLWEQYVERTGHLVSLPDFYCDKVVHLNIKEHFIFMLTRWVLSRMTCVVFSTEWLLDIWKNPYALDKKKIRVIQNAVEHREEGVVPTRKDFLWYTRDIKIKNGEMLRKAFAAAQKKCPDIYLETGMVSQEELHQKMRHCYAVVLPSISDISPNYILDAIAYRKPFLLTKHSGYSKSFADLGEIVDPFDERSIVEGILNLAQEDIYQKYVAKLNTFNGFRTYDSVATDFLSCMKSLR